MELIIVTIGIGLSLVLNVMAIALIDERLQDYRFECVAQLILQLERLEKQVEALGRAA